MTKQTVLPRWRGFNLLGMFAAPNSSKYAEKGLSGRFDEDDFQMISEFGFNFVRLPLSYKVWADESDPFKIIEEKIAPLDDAVAYGEKYGLHVNICLHRIPGYCINDDDTEPFCLWTDPEALECAKHHWRHIAKRYKGIPGEELSFNLFNEPKYDVDQATVTTVYAVWNFRGIFGIMDSGRTDIELEDYNGHKLDRELLTLLQKY